MFILKNTIASRCILLVLHECIKYARSHERNTYSQDLKNDGVLNWCNNVFIFLWEMKENLSFWDGL